MNPSPSELSESRVEALWQHASKRVLKTERRRTAIRRSVAAVVALVLVAGATWQLGLHRPPADGTRLLGTVERSGIALADDSTAKLDEAAELLIAVDRPEHVSLEVVHGRVSLDVTKRKSRVFSVKTLDVEVRVVGTRFSVRRADDDVQVEVTEGVVEVLHGSQRVRVGAGEQWNRPRPVSARSEVEAEPPEVLEEAEEAVEPSAPHKRPARPKPHRKPVEPAQPAPIAAPQPISNADALFTAGLEARRAGRGEDAARAWEAFLEAAKDDPRAPVAAFELGRLQMDVLGKQSLAALSLQRALRLAPKANFAEDALARLVQLASKRGDGVSCQEFKSEYQRRFSNGVYADTVNRQCP